ncbi:unnamed protein product [Phaedon cochleariae]|uniref:Cns1/TTC4 wheel domain-containing protein n=1 Tax=Phaedon cochleariae TaxID=80249 RepID=A0A9P0DA57_PHACE|nr:unnamed protein product [Phaedon cochleariae]
MENSKENDGNQENIDGQVKKTPMTDEERLELAKKLDADLDEFIDSLPKNKYTDGWPEDRWEEEMDKHPFFMKEPPKPGQEVHPLYEGLQKLKYDPEENEPEELAESYKVDGNFNFKHKNYRLAILAYTEGIKLKCGNPDIESNLLNNRAASHFFLKNYRSSLKDCELALKIKPDYEKVLVRAANCCFHMKQYKKAVDFCDIILDKQKDDRDILELRKKCVGAEKQKERDERRTEVETKKKAREEKALLGEILSRGYHIDGSKGNLSIDKLEPHFPQLVHNRVFLDESNSLVWPVVFFYPEYKIMDYIQHFSEHTKFLEQLNHVFETNPEWDTQNAYRANDLSVYYETPKKKIRKIDLEKSLGDILKSKEYVIFGGTPSFIILVKNSRTEELFLKDYEN